MDIKTESKVTFLKSDLLKSKKYKDKRDVITAILENDKPYTLSEVDKLINSFCKRKV